MDEPQVLLPPSSHEDASVHGGAGNDTAAYVYATSAVTASLTSGTSSGGDGNDTLTGDEASLVVAAPTAPGEYVVGVCGTVQPRGEGNVNTEMATGEIEVIGESSPLIAGGVGRSGARLLPRLVAVVAAAADR